jgi:ABC-type Fe3+/spermidine/putrescine transport system ATPase subunit
MQFEITNLAHQLGITVVYVTHDQTEALTMSDRVAVFDDGRIQQLDAPDDALREPAEQFRGPVHRREQHADRAASDRRSTAIPAR